MANTNIIGYEVGVTVFKKLSVAPKDTHQFYFKRLCENARKHKKVWFSDIIEQEKKVFNNQTIFQLLWNEEKKVWRVDLFHECK